MPQPAFDAPLDPLDGFAPTFSAVAFTAEFPGRGPSIGVDRVDFAGRREVREGGTRAKIPGS